MVIGTGFSRYNGIFIVNDEVQTNCCLKVELLNVGGGAQPLAINVGADDQGGKYTRIGTYRDLCRSVEPCKVGDQPAIRFNLADQTLAMRKRYVKLSDMHIDVTGSHRGAASPDTVLRHGMQPVDFWAIATFGNASARDHAYCKIFGDGLLGAVHRLPISETGEQRKNICRALRLQHGQAALHRFAFDPRPPRIDSGTGVPHLPHDPYWIQKIEDERLHNCPLGIQQRHKRQLDDPDSPDSPEGAVQDQRAYHHSVREAKQQEEAVVEAAAAKSAEQDDAAARREAEADPEQVVTTKRSRRTNVAAARAETVEVVRRATAERGHPKFCGVMGQRGPCRRPWGECPYHTTDEVARGALAPRAQAVAYNAAAAD